MKIHLLVYLWVVTRSGVYKKCVQHKEINPALRCEWEGIHTRSVCVCVLRERGRTSMNAQKNRFSPQMRKTILRKDKILHPWDLYVCVLSAVCYKCQNNSVFSLFGPGTHAVSSPMCVLHDVQHCLVTERLHSKLSNSCSAWRLCIICSQCVCKCVSLLWLWVERCHLSWVCLDDCILWHSIRKGGFS